MAADGRPSAKELRAALGALWGAVKEHCTNGGILGVPELVAKLQQCTLLTAAGDVRMAWGRVIHKRPLPFVLKALLQTAATSPIAELDLSANAVGDEHAKPLAAVVTSSACLRQLNVSDHRLTAVGVELIKIACAKKGVTVKGLLAPAPAPAPPKGFPPAAPSQATAASLVSSQAAEAVVAAAAPTPGPPAAAAASPSLPSNVAALQEMVDTRLRQLGLQSAVELEAARAALIQELTAGAGAGALAASDGGSPATQPQHTARSRTGSDLSSATENTARPVQHGGVAAGRRSASGSGGGAEGGAAAVRGASAPRTPRQQASTKAQARRSSPAAANAVTTPTTRRGLGGLQPQPQPQPVTYMKIHSGQQQPQSQSARGTSSAATSPIVPVGLATPRGSGGGHAAAALSPPLTQNSAGGRGSSRYTLSASPSPLDRMDVASVRREAGGRADAHAHPHPQPTRSTAAAVVQEALPPQPHPPVGGVLVPAVHMVAGQPAAAGGGARGGAHAAAAAAPSESYAVSAADSYDETSFDSGTLSPMRMLKGPQGGPAQVVDDTPGGHMPPPADRSLNASLPLPHHVGGGGSPSRASGVPNPHALASRSSPLITPSRYKAVGQIPMTGRSIKDELIESEALEKENTDPEDVYDIADGADETAMIRDFSRSKLTTIAHRDLSNITVLILRGNALKELAPLPPTLARLDVSRNALTGLGGLQRCADLEIVVARRNKIARLGKDLHGCPRVHTLLLGHNSMRRVDGIEHLANLRYLDLGHNELATPASVRTLSLNAKVQTLVLKGNPLAHAAGRRRICVSNLPPWADEAGITQLLAAYGCLESLYILPNRTTKDGRKAAFAVFHDQDDAAKACATALTQQHPDLDVELKPKKGKLLIAGADPSMTKEVLKEKLTVYGPLESMEFGPYRWEYRSPAGWVPFPDEFWDRLNAAHHRKGTCKIGTVLVKTAIMRAEPQSGGGAACDVRAQRDVTVVFAPGHVAAERAKNTISGAGIYPDDDTTLTVRQMPEYQPLIVNLLPNLVDLDKKYIAPGVKFSSTTNPLTRPPFSMQQTGAMPRQVSGSNVNTTTTQAKAVDSRSWSRLIDTTASSFDRSKTPTALDLSTAAGRLVLTGGDLDNQGRESYPGGYAFPGRAEQAVQKIQRAQSRKEKEEQRLRKFGLQPSQQGAIVREYSASGGGGGMNTSLRSTSARRSTSRPGPGAHANASFTLSSTKDWERTGVQSAARSRSAPSTSVRRGGPLGTNGDASMGYSAQPLAGGGDGRVSSGSGLLDTTAPSAYSSHLNTTAGTATPMKPHQHQHHAYDGPHLQMHPFPVSPIPVASGDDTVLSAEGDGVTFGGEGLHDLGGGSTAVHPPTSVPPVHLVGAEAGHATGEAPHPRTHERLAAASVPVSRSLVPPECKRQPRSRGGRRRSTGSTAATVRGAAAQGGRSASGSGGGGGGGGGGGARPVLENTRAAPPAARGRTAHRADTTHDTSRTSSRARSAHSVQSVGSNGELRSALRRLSTAVEQAARSEKRGVSFVDDLDDDDYDGHAPVTSVHRSHSAPTPGAALTAMDPVTPRRPPTHPNRSVSPRLYDALHGVEQAAVTASTPKPSPATQQRTPVNKATPLGKVGLLSAPRSLGKSEPPSPLVSDGLQNLYNQLQALHDELSSERPGKSMSPSRLLRLITPVKEQAMHAQHTSRTQSPMRGMGTGDMPDRRAPPPPTQAQAPPPAAAEEARAARRSVSQRQAQVQAQPQPRHVSPARQRAAAPVVGVPEPTAAAASDPRTMPKSAPAPQEVEEWVADVHVGLTRAHLALKALIVLSGSAGREEQQRYRTIINQCGMLGDTEVPVAIVKYFKLTEADVQAPVLPEPVTKLEALLALLKQLSDTKTCLKYIFALIDQGTPRALQEYIERAKMSTLVTLDAEHFKF